MPQRSEKIPIETNTAAVRPAANDTVSASGSATSANAPIASRSIDRPTSVASAPQMLARIAEEPDVAFHRLARLHLRRSWFRLASSISLPRSAGRAVLKGQSKTCLTCHEFGPSRRLCNENAELDSGGRIVARDEREVEAGAIGHARRHCHVELMTAQLGPAAVAADAPLGPGFAAPAALAARARKPAPRAAPWHLRVPRAASAGSWRSALPFVRRRETIAASGRRRAPPTGSPPRLHPRSSLYRCGCPHRRI